jgi:hypothetical protein
VCRYAPVPVLSWVRTEDEFRFLRCVQEVAPRGGRVGRTGVQCIRTIQSNRNVIRASSGPSVSYAPNWQERWILRRCLRENCRWTIPAQSPKSRPACASSWGHYMLLLREPHGPTGIRSIRMRSENRRRIKSLRGRSSRRTQLLSRFWHPGTHTPRTLKESLHREDVLDPILSMLNAAAFEIEISSAPRATTDLASEVTGGAPDCRGTR